MEDDVKVPSTPGNPRQKGARDPIRKALDEAREHLDRCQKLQAAAPRAAGQARLDSWASRVRELEKAERLFPRNGKMPRKDRPRCGVPRRRDGQPCQGRAVWDEENDRPRSRNGRCKHHGGAWPACLLDIPRDEAGRWTRREPS